ncbi:hypothetical protein K1719_028509 [Acacia pycnantha]|nr:hypothetical protein K1719_028509 [Acacia pycnantha]
MSSSKKKLRFNTVSVDIGCGNCRKPNISHILYPKSKPRKPTNQKLPLRNYSSSGSWDKDDTTATFSPYGSSSDQFSSGGENNERAPKTVRGLGRVGARAWRWRKIPTTLIWTSATPCGK